VRDGRAKGAITASPMNFSTVPPRRFELRAQALVVQAEQRLDIIWVGARHGS
jgi:hypothetical protein